MSGIDWDKLPEALAEHRDVYWARDDGGTFCACDVKLSDDMVAEPGHALDAHLAAVVRAWVEGQMTEEWGVHTSLYSPYYVMRSQSRERAEEMAQLNPQLGPTIHRRLVTPWAPMEEAKP